MSLYKNVGLLWYALVCFCCTKPKSPCDKLVKHQMTSAVSKTQVPIFLARFHQVSKYRQKGPILSVWIISMFWIPEWSRNRGRVKQPQEEAPSCINNQVGLLRVHNSLFNYKYMPILYSILYTLYVTINNIMCWLHSEDLQKTTATMWAFWQWILGL